MTYQMNKIRLLVILLIAVTGLIPIVTYYGVVGNVPTVRAGEAIARLANSDGGSILVDVRDPRTYESEHLEGAINWPYEKIVSLKSREDIPEPFKGKTLFLVCESGIQSALAAGKLRDWLPGQVYSVKGGLQEWIGAPRELCPLNLCRVETVSGEIKPLPFQELSLFEQAMASFTAFGVKPLYMLISLGLAVTLRKVKSSDLVALKWAFVFFFIGEGFCAINYLFMREDSHLVEFLHSFGMVVAFGFTTYALLEAADVRVMRYSTPEEKCAALPLCGSCVKYTDVACGFRRVFQWIIPYFIILSFVPLLASPHPSSYNSSIFGTIYNYSHPVIFQLFEIRYAPVAAIILFAVASSVLWFIKDDPVPLAKIFFAGGMGFFGFSMFRLILFGVYRDDLVWYIVWEELTELLYIGIAAIVLWIFRRRLFSEEEAGGLFTG